MATLLSSPALLSSSFTGTLLKRSAVISCTMPRAPSRFLVRADSPTDHIKERVRDVESTRQGLAQNVKAASDSTKVNITPEDVERNMQKISEQRSVIGTRPSSTSPFPRPETERRPEVGDTSFGSLMAFDGAGPETINGRLAMLGFFIAAGVELWTGQTVAEQIWGVGGETNLIWYFALVQLIFVASIIPLTRRESPDSRQIGPFTAKAERWNGRLAMLSFFSLVVLEYLRGQPVFPHIF